MIEDALRTSCRARMRLFLFPVNPTLATSFGTSETKSERRWFVVALNSIQIQPLDDSSPPAADAGMNLDFLFGLDKKHASSHIVQWYRATPEK
ncbi:hypothetical protein RHMOL_Rhmol09G0118500 [Rhododendron molle]|uniref:Uncharacterized protein n=1 Tax=Rhododendron molle TaxID=49168 RepID=A0ACC0MDK5_RHOML|nr:hypothetical protein RHMOL_Rhmol09G0118500 [Rhododendron molle]